jgi:Domain of unknown function (DUF4136)
MAISIKAIIRMGLLGLFASLVLAGCASTPTVRSGSAPNADFNAFRTFSFVSPLSTDRAGFHTLVSQQVVASTRRELEVRGLEFVANPEQADMLVNVHAQVAEQLRVRSTPDPWVGTSYWNHRRGRYQPWPGHSRWPAPSRVEVDQFSEGRLSVDLVDRRSNTLVWEGVASQRLNQRTMNDLGPAIDVAIHDVFAQLPLQPRL